MDDFFGIMLVLLVGCLCFLVGKWMDAEFRVKQLRNITRQNYVLAGLVSDDLKSITDKVVVEEGGMVKVGKFMWVIANDFIYRKDKVDQKFPLKDHLKWKEGIPYVFFSRKSILPLSFQIQATATTPENFDSVMTSWFSNMQAKLFVLVKENNMFLKMAAIGAVGACIGILLTAYILNTQIEAAKAQLYTQQSVIEQVHNDTIMLRAHFGLFQQSNQTNNSVLIINGR